MQARDRRAHYIGRLMSWRRILLLSLVFVAVLASVTWAFLQHSDAATQVVRRELQALFRTPTAVATTSIDVVAGRLLVSGVRLDDPARPGFALLSLDQVAVDVALTPSAALVGVHAVTVEGFALELGPTLPEAGELLAKPTAPVASTPSLPPILLRSGRIRWTPGGGEAPVELRDVTLAATPADGARGWLQLHGSAVIADLGATVQVDGEVNLDSGEVRGALTTGGVLLTTATLARVARLLGEEAPPFEVAATLKSATVAVQVPAPGTAGAAPRIETTAELTAVCVRSPQLPELVRTADVTLHGCTDGGGTATVRLRQQDASGKLDVTAHGTGLLHEGHVDVRVHGTDLLIDREVIRALESFETGNDIVRALRPTAGRADLELFLRDPHRRGGLAELELSLRDVAMSFHGFGEGEQRAAFPLPMVSAKGRVRLRDDVILLEDVQAAIAEQAGGGTVVLQGRVDTNLPGGEDASLDIHATNVAFQPDLRAALATLLDDEGAIYDKFAPIGRTEVVVRVRPQSELPGGWSVDVRPSGSTMQWAGFPYQLDDVRGNVRAQENGVTFDLSGVHGAGRLTMRGTIPIGDPTEDPGFAADVDVKDVTIDDDLRRAVAVLAPDLDGPWRDSAASGRLHGHVNVWRPRPDDPLFYEARLELSGVDLRLPKAPWQARALQGQVFVQGLAGGTRIDFDALRGRLEHCDQAPAALAMLGSLVLGDGAGSDLAFVVRGLELDEQLGQTLEELGALGKAAWSSLRPSGHVDLVCRHQRAAGQDDQIGLVVHLVDVRSDAPMLPRPAEHMTGELTVANGRLRFDDVRAQMGRAMVQCTAGEVHTEPGPDGDTTIAFTVDAKGATLDDGFANLFSGPLREAVLQRHLRGRADVDSLRLQFHVPPAGSKRAFATTLAGQLRIYDLEMTIGEGPEGTVVQGISGVVDLAESRVSDDGGGLKGALRGISLRVFSQPFEAIEAALHADAERIVLTSMTSRLHGGSVRSARANAPALEYLLPGPNAPEGRLSTDLIFEEVDVYTFLDTCGWINPPYSGSAHGAIRLERLDGNDVIDAAGFGSVLVERADLGVVPLFTAIYAQLPASDRPRFDALEMRFRVADRRVDFEQLDVRSNILAAQGRGTLSLDGYLDVELELDNLLGASADPLVMPLIEYLAKNIVRFHLHGYLRDLHAERRWVTERDPRRRPMLPMPPGCPRPTAPEF